MIVPRPGGEMVDTGDLKSLSHSTESAGSSPAPGTVEIHMQGKSLMIIGGSLVSVCGLVLWYWTIGWGSVAPVNQREIPVQQEPVVTSTLPLPARTTSTTAVFGPVP